MYLQLLQNLLQKDQGNGGIHDTAFFGCWPGHANIFTSRRRGFSEFVGTTNLSGFTPMIAESVESWINKRKMPFFLTVSLGGKVMLRNNGGRIVLTSSVAGSLGLVNHEAIAAAKGGLEGLVKSAAATYAKNNIRVNALALGLVESNLSNGIVSNPAALEVSKKMHSIGSIGSPEIIAKFATPLILDSSSWITGSIFNIDGGLSTTKLVS